MGLIDGLGEEDSKATGMEALTQNVVQISSHYYQIRRVVTALAHLPVKGFHKRMLLKMSLSSCSSSRAAPLGGISDDPSYLLDGSQDCSPASIGSGISDMFV